MSLWKKDQIAQMVSKTDQMVSKAHMGPLLRGGTTTVYDKIDLDDFEFNEAAKYVEFASKNLYMIDKWDNYMGAGFTIYDILVAHYFESRKLNVSGSDVKKVSKVLQEAGVSVECQKAPYKVVI